MLLFKYHFILLFISNAWKILFEIFRIRPFVSAKWLILLKFLSSLLRAANRVRSTFDSNAELQRSPECWRKCVLVRVHERERESARERKRERERENVRERM